MVRKIFFSILLTALLFPAPGFSDVVEEGETTIYFKVLNLSEFSDFQFYYYYQDYYYNQGYQPGEKFLVWIEEGKEYSGGDKGSSAVIMARLKSDTTKIFETKDAFGGTEIINGRRVSSLLDEITILRMEDGTIDVKTKRFEVNGNGDKKPVKGGFFGGLYEGPFQFWGINGWVLLMPLAALLALLVFFIWRKNLTRRQNAGLAA